MINIMRFRISARSGLFETKHNLPNDEKDLELQRKNETNVSKARILAVFEMIWNCRDNFENNVR